MWSEEFVKVYESKLKGPNRRGKPLGRWRDRVEEYLGEREKERERLMQVESLKNQWGSVGVRKGGDSPVVATSWGDISREN